MTFDQTEHEKYLNKRSQAFEELTKLLPEAIYECNLEGGIVYANPVAFEMFAYTPADFEGGLNVFQMVTPEDRERLRANMELIAAGKKTTQSEYTALRKDGTTFPVITHSVPSLYEGKPIGLRGILMDISDRKRLETELREKSDEIQSIFDSSPSAIIVTDITGRITGCNEITALLIGAPSKREILGKNIVDFVSARSRTRALKDIRKTMKNGKVSNSEYKLKRTDGTEFFAELSAGAVKDMTGKPASFICVVSDITEKKKAEQMKNDFFSTVSHELRTPVSVIRGVATNLLDGIVGALNREQTNYLKIAKENAERLQHLINNILDLSKLEAKKVRLNLEMLDLDELTDSIISMLKPRYQEKNISVEKSFPRQLPAVSADRQKLIQVITNIFDNAIKYSNENGKIVLSAKPLSGGNIEIDISDNGIGIAKENLPRLFDKFYQAASPDGSVRSGTGLGLSIVKHIIELHKGKIWVESEVGKGSSFKFTLSSSKEGG